MACPPRVTRAIESVPEVRYARVSFERERAEVQASSCEERVFEAISGALIAEGYGGTVVEISDGAPASNDRDGGGAAISTP